MGGAGWRPAPEHVGWTALAAIAAVLAGLSAASSLNYASVVVAHSVSYVVPAFEIAYEQTAPDGTLTANSTVRASLALRVENPSSRTLRFSLVAYGGWIEDWPLEDGWNDSRKNQDKAVVNGSGSTYFFPAFGESLNVVKDPVPPGGNATLSLSFALSRATDPQRFDAMRNITEWGAARSGSPSAVPWNHWVRVDLTIDGVPEPSSNEAGYLRDLRRIEFQWGSNLGF